MYLETQITDGGKSRLIERREVVTCHPETRDLRCDIRVGRCDGDRGNSCRCQVLPGQRKRTRHGIFTDVLLIFLFKFVSLLCFLSSAFTNFVFFSFCSSHSPLFLLFFFHSTSLLGKSGCNFECPLAYFYELGTRLFFSNSCQLVRRKDSGVPNELKGGNNLHFPLESFSNFSVARIGGGSYWAGRAAARPLFGLRGPQLCLARPRLAT